MKERAPISRGGVKKGIYILPNLMTSASLFCGFYALIAAVKERFELAAIVIFIAMILDSLDGRIARMTNTTSKFGAEYDSLSDLIAFGVAPSTLAYMWSLSAFGKWGWVASFLFVICGALRLARFNIQIGIVESKVFNGLPIPGAAAVVASSVLLYHYFGLEGHFENLIVLVLVVALSMFMVSNIKYYSFKDLNFFARKPFMSFLLIVLVLVIVATEPQIMIFTFFLGYSLSGPIWSLYKLTIKAYTAAKERRKIPHRR